MSEENTVNETKAKTILGNPLAKKIIIYGSILIVVFLIGFVPMWMKARDCSASLAKTQRELKLANMEITIGSSVIDARRGEYEVARQTASAFFTTLRAERERDKDSVLTVAQREEFRPMLTERDTVITLLARNDPASVEWLLSMYLTYRKTIRGL